MRFIRCPKCNKGILHKQDFIHPDSSSFSLKFIPYYMCYTCKWQISVDNYRTVLNEMLEEALEEV